MEDKKYELSEEELNKIAGGQNLSGKILCANCKNMVTVNIQQLIKEGSMKCPFCGVSMDIDVRESLNGLSALKKAEENNKNTI